MKALRVVTSAGWAAIVLCVAAYVGGWWLGWLELMILAAGCGIALIIAAISIFGRFPFEIDRSIQPRQVTVGEDAFGLLQVTNTGRVPTFPRTARDNFGDRPIPVRLPSLRPQVQHEVRYRLPTEARGVYEVGPVVVSRTDPLGLLRRQRTHGEVDGFTVYPRIHPVRLSASGITKDLDGPTSDSSPQGGIAFHTIRPYELGDDYRHIHWRSTAKTGGSLMVRHFVDNRRPYIGVVLDTHRDSYANQASFELAVEIVASLSQSAMRAGMPAGLHAATPDGDGFSGSTMTRHLDEAASIAMQDERKLGDFISAAAKAESRATTMVVVTGGLTSAEVDVALRSVRHVPKLVVVRALVNQPDAPDPHPSLSGLDVSSGEEFSQSWDRVFR